MVTVSPRQILVLPDALFAFRLGDTPHLDGARLAAHGKSPLPDARPEGRAQGFVDDRIHGAADKVQMGRHQSDGIENRPRIGLGAFVAGTLRCQARRHGEAAVDKPCHHYRHLQRRRQKISLPDPGQQRLSLVPGRVQGLAFPFGRRHQARLLAGQVDAQGLPEAQAPRHGGDAVDAGAPGHFIEINVTRLDDAAEGIHPSVPALFPAVELGVAEFDFAGAQDSVLGRYDSLFQRRQHDHHFEG